MSYERLPTSVIRVERTGHNAMPFIVRVKALGLGTGQDVAFKLNAHESEVMIDMLRFLLDNVDVHVMEARA